MEMGRLKKIESTILLNLLLYGMWIMTAAFIGVSYGIDSIVIDLFQMSGLMIMVVLLWNNR